MHYKFEGEDHYIKNCSLLPVSFLQFIIYKKEEIFFEKFLLFAASNSVAAQRKNKGVAYLSF
jgi:hypothetical protein